MPEIEITEDQQEYLEDLRSELEADIVGPYGHVRISDAVQYLIDDHDGTLDDVLAEGTGGVEESDDESGDTEDEPEPEDAETDEESEDADEADDEDANDEDESDSAESGEDRLSAMMSLLDTHDDKWRETEGDARYEVDLPDGTTENAGTKDDVRAVLFKNY
ncbi:hypothetical protein [Natranaeroarchaeum aerophilus]|uniref:Uncharacterized protein n=1 Tax=Natranaeroarchaeum aerophilus TaxID=2917711 RepID=A0AAE3FQV6_9EURY|nr:hypothetical protein [Natranaeroarchaeum aerophilus]MCL9813440.1 hypothetical protein [Natranaeroarchaeum aerophilus]